MIRRQAILSVLGALVVALLLTSVFCTGADPASQQDALDLSAAVTPDGTLKESAKQVSADGRLTIEAPGGSIVLNAHGAPLQSIEVHEIANELAPAPGDHITGTVYDLGPDGATFDPPATVTLRYDSALLPAGVPEDSLLIAFYNDATGQWVALPSTVNATNSTVTAAISHFTMFGLHYPAPATVFAGPPSPTAAPSTTVPATPAATATPAPTSTATPAPSSTLEPTPAPTDGGDPAAPPEPTPAPPQAPAPSPTPAPTYTYLPEVPRVSVQEVKAKLDAGSSIAIIDSRSAQAYAESRIPGAISLPLTAMAPPYSDLDAYDEIATYCT